MQALMAAACAAGSAALIVWLLTDRLVVKLIAAAGHDGEESSARELGSSARRLVLPSLRRVRRLLPTLVTWVARRDVSVLISRAGLDGQLLVRDIAAARLLCVLLAAAMLPRLVAVLPMRMLPLAVITLLIGAAELPVWWLRRRADRRSVALRSALPDALELMRACLAAGLPLRRSLSLVADHCAEPVATEFACVAAETAFGIPQATALDGLVARNPEPEIRSLVSAVRQAERHGSPLAPVIAAQAHDARLALNREIVERAARAAPKIQLIVSTTIVPAALLAFAAVVIAAIARGDLQFL